MLKWPHMLCGRDCSRRNSADAASTNWHGAQSPVVLLTAAMFRAQVFGFKAWGLRLRICGLGFRV